MTGLVASSLGNIGIFLEDNLRHILNHILTFHTHFQNLFGFKEIFFPLSLESFAASFTHCVFPDTFNTLDLHILKARRLRKKSL